MTEGYVVILSTAPTAEQAAALARTLVEERLVACVNVLPIARSIYRWQGQIVDEPEQLCLMKTRADHVEALRARLTALHPYAVPELLVLDVRSGHEPYLSWIDASLA